jgi:hypothetical protein
MGILSDFTLILFCAHLLGDFHLQSNDLSGKKARHNKYLFTHLTIYAVTFLIPLFILFLNDKWVQGMIFFAVTLFAHLIIDFLKIIFNRRYTQWENPAFIADQVLHTGVIILLSELCFNNDFSTLNLYGMSRDVISWCLLMLLISKPANVIHKQFLNKYNIPQQISPDRNEETTVSGAGALIGNLERTLSVIFLHINQIAAIGLIYTAKSIARFKEIEDNRRFAEYYLIGTLYSILYAISAYYFVIVL